MNLRPPQKLAFGTTQGSRLSQALLEYLNWESFEAEAKNKEAVREVLRQMISKSGRDGDISERDLERLVEATLTIGSFAIDRITRRLEIIGAAAGWGDSTDYRALAHQLHSITGQARKLKNSVAQRRKCVKAILSKPEFSNKKQIDGIWEFSQIKDVSSLSKWTLHAFNAFKNSGQVKERFMTTYEYEWNTFTNDALKYLFVPSVSEDESIKSRYDKYIEIFSQEISKTNLKWSYEVVSSSGKRVDFEINNGVTIDLKKRPDHFSFIVTIPSNFETNFREIPLALMDLLEQRPGFKYVDISQPLAETHQMSIEIRDNYTMEQIAIAQSEIIQYFEKRF
jgi:hypothetical protein